MHCLALLLATCAAASPTSSQSPAAQRAAGIADGMLCALTEIPPFLPAITSVAERAADRLVASGRIFMTGPAQGLVSEALGRAGGMMTLQGLGDPSGLRQGDVVLYASVKPVTDADETSITAACGRGALVVGVTRRPFPGPPGLVDVLGRAKPAARPEPEEYHVSASPAFAAVTWTFTGELVSAVARRGKMLPMYQSIVVPEGKARNASRLGLDWEPNAVPPVKAGLLGRTYLARLAACLRRMKATQMPRFAEAGKLAWDALEAGHTVWQMPVGHMPPYEPGLTEDHVTKTLPQDMTPEKLAGLVKPGDVILYEGYYEPFGPWVETAHELGAKIVTVVSGTPDKPASAMGADVCIDGCWPYGDALVDVPGYDVRILPPSGVIQSLAYWMLEDQLAFRATARGHGE
jgi:hypothetical protein